MGMNSYGKEFQYKELFLDLGIPDLLKPRHSRIPFATLSFEASFSEYPWCLNSTAPGATGTSWDSALPLPSQVTLHILWAAFASELGWR